MEAPSDEDSIWSEQNLLAELTGLLPSVELPPLPIVSGGTVPPVDQDQGRDADLLAEIASAPPAPPRQRGPEAPLPSGKPAGAWYGLLIGLVLLAALVPRLLEDRFPAAAQPGSGERSLWTALEELSEEKRVVVAFDYGPAASAELAPLHRALLATLRGRSVPIIALSTRPEGVAIAASAMQPQSQAGNPDADIQNGVLLGYLAGDAAGLRLAETNLPAAFAYKTASGTAWSDVPLLNGLNKLSDADAVVLLTDDLHTARRWIEQVGPWNDQLLLITNAAIAPQLEPYAASGQVAALVAGATASAALPAGEAQGGWSIASGYLAFWAVSVLAMVLGLLHSGRRRRSERR
ncbi:MAG: hypothetical protein ACOX2L_08765 [Anaerolineae bacterium]|nr:hypothetical protein [Chloroflexota bacterium]